MEHYEEIDAILPDDFDINNENYSLDNPTTEAEPTTEQPVESNESVVTEEAATEESTTPPEEPAPIPVPQTVKVRYNHEDRELSLDEAAILAQKGMNYDKLDERVKSFEAANARNERLAKQLGYANASEMMDAAERNYRDSQIRELVDAGNTEAMAKFLVDQQMKAIADEAKKAEPRLQEQPTRTAPMLTPQRKAELDEFIMAYPGVTSFPPEVAIANRNGVRLKDAYEQYLSKSKPQQTATPEQKELAKTKAELQVLKQNQANAAKAPVIGATGKATMTDPVVNEDPFMKGFNSAY